MCNMCRVYRTCDTRIDMSIKAADADKTRYEIHFQSPHSL
jgi:hypothetical protein